MFGVMYRCGVFCFEVILFDVVDKINPAIHFLINFVKIHVFIGKKPV